MDIKTYSVMAQFKDDFIYFYSVTATDLENARKEFYNRIEKETNYKKEQIIIYKIFEE